MLLGEISENLKKAQLAREDLRVSTLRLLISAINYEKIQKGRDLSDEEIISVVQKEVKKRKEAALGFRQGQREDSAKKEEREAIILEEYLPEQLSDAELTKVVEDTITELGANSLSDIGRVIGSIMAKVFGKANGGRVSNLVKQKLSP